MATSDPNDPLGGDEDLIGPLAEDDMKVNLLPPEEPEAGGSRFSLRRVLLLIGVVFIIAGGGYLGYTLFLAPPPEPPAPSRIARPPAPVAKAPAPAPGAPSPSVPPAVAKSPVPPAPPAGATPQAPATKVAEAPKPPSANVEGPKKVETPTPPATALEVAKAPEPALKPPSAATPKVAAPPAKAKTPAIVPAGFSLQVGAMAIQENAQNLKKRLDAGGFACTIRKGSVHLNKHVVTVGEPVARRDAEEMARRLNVDGFPSEIVPMEGKYTPQLGAFLSQDEAIDLAREVQKKQYRPRITQRALTTQVYQVRHGEFDTRAAALKRADELKAKGFPGSFVVRK